MIYASEAHKLTFKIVITSTGELQQGLSKEAFFSGVSAPRNKELMRVFKDLKLVEHLGSGMLGY
jgi:ATP-dependent DNA helicase RecG